jgi:His/Glu/Gln/Arg/opine family amino acid ABC transporter permease subunit
MQGNGILNLNYMFESIPKIASGISVSLSIAGVAFIFGMLIGFGIALGKVYKIPVLQRICQVYVSFMRGTPLLVQIFLTYYGIPLVLRFLGEAYGWELDVSKIPAIYFMYVCFSLNVGAYLSETFRGAILSVNKGQIEAAQSLGMSEKQVLRRVIIPQALQVALPNMGNTFISLLKDTSLAFAASVPEIMGQAKISAARTSNFFEAYIVAAMMYWIICIIFERIIALVEYRIRKHERELIHD